MRTVATRMTGDCPILARAMRVADLHGFCSAARSAAPRARAGASAAGLTRARGLSRAARLEALGRDLVLRSVALRLGADVLRLLPRPGARLRAAQRAPVQLGGKDLRQPGLRAVPSLDISAGGAAIHRALFRIRRRRRRQHRQRADRRPHLGRPRRSRPRPGAPAAALAVRDGQRRTPAAVAAKCAAAAYAGRAAPGFRRRRARRHRQGVRGGPGGARGL